SLLGFGTGLIRFLPVSKQKNEKINTAFTLVCLAAIFLSIIYLIGLKTFSPKLLFIRENIIFAILFILFVVFSSLNTISENVFIAYRSSKYILIKNTAFSIAKLALPILLISLGAYGIFASVGIASVVAVVLSLIFLILKFNYSINPTINKEVAKRMTKFSIGNYVAGFIGGLPIMVLPIIITNQLGPKFTAYYFMPMMIVSFLYIIPQATTRSLFAEGSHREGEVGKLFNKSLKLNAFLLLPAMMAVYFFGKYILLVFGFEYAKQGTEFLQLLAISGTFIYINSVGGVLLNIRHQIKKLITINITSTLLILGLSYLLISKELMGLGFAWIIGQAIISVIYLYFLLRNQ
ncbi:MAG: oligosaccharide flippase family protein, partial [bacterium]|nr:oligosaccharide flippase family protein [bacterium]